MTEGIRSLPVRRSIVVETSLEDAFAAFTDDIDSWWPRTHHIGKAPMRRIVIEGRPGGRCYTEHEDGTECDFGRVLEWEPPHRLVLAWQMTHAFGIEPDARRASEVEVSFRPDGRAWTRVDLEHRSFDRHEGGPEPMRTNVDAPNGWTLVLSRFTDRAARAAPVSELEVSEGNRARGRRLRTRVGMRHGCSQRTPSTEDRPHDDS